MKCKLRSDLLLGVLGLFLIAASVPSIVNADTGGTCSVSICGSCYTLLLCEAAPGGCLTSCGPVPHTVEGEDRVACGCNNSVPTCCHVYQIVNSLGAKTGWNHEGDCWDEDTSCGPEDSNTCSAEEVDTGIWKAICEIWT